MITKVQEHLVIEDEMAKLEVELFRLQARITAGKKAGLDDYVKQHVELMARTQALFDAFKELKKGGSNG